MNIKIYQAYFDNSQLAHLDPEFVPLDNTENLQSDLREYPIFRKCRERAIQDNADVWGYMSWKWKHKLPNLNASNIINRIADNPGYDVYFFNYTKTTFYYNVWEHGSIFHKHILEIMTEAFSLMGVDTDILYQPMTNEVSFFALYCAGNARWWNGLIDFTTRFLNVIPLLSPRVRELYETSADYANDTKLNYFPFIHERLLSTYLLLNKDNLKILPYHNVENQPFENMLENIKTEASRTFDQSLADAWFRLRNSYYPGFENWASKLKKINLSSNLTNI